MRNTEHIGVSASDSDRVEKKHRRYEPKRTLSLNKKK